MSEGDSLRVRRAIESDLDALVTFTTSQVRESEGAIKGPDVVQLGIRRALQDEELAMYWVLVDESDNPVGCASALKEWSDWNAGYYWWLQSMYVSADQRGKGGMALLIDAVKSEMMYQGGIELRLYVNKDNIQAKQAYERYRFKQSVYEVMVLDEE